MSTAMKPMLKPFSMANGCLISPQAILTPKTSYPHLSIPLRPIKLQLSYSFNLKKKTHFPSFVSFVAAQREEDNTVILEEEEEEEEQPEGEFKWENEELDGAEARASDWEGEETVEAVGDAAGEEEEEYSEPSEDAKVFVGNLPYDVDSEKLAQLFEKAGIVEIAEVIYNRETDQSRGFGFVTMSTVEEAEKAVDLFHRYDLGGRFLTVNKAAPRGSRPERTPQTFEPSYRIYVGNLPWDVDDARLEQVFSEHGKVVNARVVYDRDSGRSRGFGFVTMASESELNDAVANLDGQSLGGRAIRVNVAEERPRRGAF